MCIYINTQYWSEYSFNEDLWVQSDNASSQYKNKHSFGLLQSLTDEFSLRIICTYGPGGYGKGAIDAMSNFGVKNVLRKDIVSRDVFSKIVPIWLSIFLQKIHSTTVVLFKFKV